MPRPMLRTPQNQTQSQTVNNNILSATRNQEHEQQQQQMDYPSATAVFASSFTGTILSTLRGLIPDLHLKNCPTRCISR